MADITTQLVVLGAGPGGYAAAFRAADLGLSVTLIDAAANPGGVCLYRGCIPSKALLHVAKLIEETRHASKWGVTFSEPNIDLDKLRDYKAGVVKKLTGGLGALSKARKINFVQGYGSFVDAKTIEVELAGGKGKQRVSFDSVVIATGSEPLVLPHLSLDSDRVMDSTDALELPDIPESLLLIGGGVIGMEIGMVYNTLGSNVSVVEMLPRILAGADDDIAKPLIKKINKEFEEVMLNTKVTGIKLVGKGKKEGVEVTFDTPTQQGVKKVYSRVLVAIGRKPNTGNIGIENTGVKLSERGFIEVNKQLQTNVTGVYAIGDIVGNPMLAHKASHEAHVAVDNINGTKAEFAPYCIPSVVFTNPEMAWCGVTETEAKAGDIAYEAVTFPWAASGRATSVDATEGLTKLIFDPATQRLLGMGIIGAGAGDLISEGALAIEMGATAEDLGHTIHPHPTLSETIMEASELQIGHCDHFIAKKKKK